MSGEDRKRQRERDGEGDGEGNSEIAVFNALETKKGVQWSFRTCPSLVHSLRLFLLSK